MSFEDAPTLVAGNLIEFGDEYPVIAAGGHTMHKSTMGDAVIAYKLKRARP